VSTADVREGVAVIEVHIRLRVHTTSPETLPDIQIEQGEQLGILGEGFIALHDDMNDRLAKMDERFDAVESEMRNGFVELRDGFTKLMLVAQTALKRRDQT
jgi:hypothetical protein